MRQRPFQQVDVFSAAPYGGNALAVVLDASGLSDAEMQRFAAWTQLSETAFVLPPSPQGLAAGADYRVRIFTTAYEMPFAGHPTLGACHAWLQAGGQPRTHDVVVQECAVGLVHLRRDGTVLAFAAPPSTHAALECSTQDALAHALGLPPGVVQAAQRLCNGPTHVALLLHGPDALEQVWGLRPDADAVRTVLRPLGASGVGVVARHPNTPEAPVALIRRASREARAFAPTAPGATSAPGSTTASTDTGAAHPSSASASGQPPSPPPHLGSRPPEPDDTVDLEARFFADDAQLVEDPATGSFHAALAPWLMDSGHLGTRYTVAQGRSIGRDARLHLQRDHQGQVWVGGQCQPSVSGIVTL